MMLPHTVEVRGRTDAFEAGGDRPLSTASDDRFEQRNPGAHVHELHVHADEHVLLHRQQRGKQHRIFCQSVCFRPAPRDCTP